MKNQLTTLKHAFARFKSHYFEKKPALKTPPIMLITCSDSRIVPPELFGTERLFVVRSVGNLIHPFDDQQKETQAAIKHAVHDLNVEHIIILGHSQCGGIKALLQREDGNSAGNCIDAWIQGASPVAQQIKTTHATSTLEEQSRSAELASVQHGLTLLAKYPFIRDRLNKATLQLHGWYFDMQQGQLLCSDPNTSQFIAYTHALSPASPTSPTLFFKETDRLSPLKQAFTAFKTHYFEKEPACYQQLTTQGQAPEVMLITDSNADVVPAQLFGTKPGDLFIARFKNRLVPAFQDKEQGIHAAIEYAICHLKVKQIIILGHGSINCTANQHTELASIQQALTSLAKYPFIRDRLNNATLQLHGWYFDMRAIKLLCYDPNTCQFIPSSDDDCCSISTRDTSVFQN